MIGRIDSGGKQVVSYNYNSWGKPRAITDTSEEGIGSLNPFRYRGYCYDEETGYYYLKSRYYDPVVGRFLSADDVDAVTALPRSIADKNLYVYCNNNPINLMDATGKSGILATLGAMVIGAVINVIIACLMAGLTGQWDNFKGDDILAAAISGAVGASPLGPIWGMLVDGIMTAYLSYTDGEKLGTALLNGLLTAGFSCYGFGDLGLDKVASAAYKGVIEFGTGLANEAVTLIVNSNAENRSVDSMGYKEHFHEAPKMDIETISM